MAMRIPVFCLLDFVDAFDLATTVIAAVLADLMRRLELVALRALAERGRLERVVGAALGGARLGVSSFRIRHVRYLLNSGISRLRDFGIAKSQMPRIR
jgi:hypothetical protein